MTNNELADLLDRTAKLIEVLNELITFLMGENMHVKPNVDDQVKSDMDALRQEAKRLREEKE